jgi:hypothetical protein
MLQHAAQAPLIAAKPLASIHAERSNLMEIRLNADLGTDEQMATLHKLLRLTFPDVEHRSRPGTGGVSRKSLGHRSWVDIERRRNDYEDETEHSEQCHAGDCGGSWR